jgi:hypothetical protein
VCVPYQKESLPEIWKGKGIIKRGMEVRVH